MKILFLGTGAADWPAEKPAGCKEFRRLSSALIDDVLLIGLILLLSRERESSTGTLLLLALLLLT